MSGALGYRVLLTLELQVDTNQELVMKVDGIYCTNRLEMPGYRAACLQVKLNEEGTVA